jgi:hypothetical protein
MKAEQFKKYLTKTTKTYKPREEGKSDSQIAQDKREQKLRTQYPKNYRELSERFCYLRNQDPTFTTWQCFVVALHKKRIKKQTIIDYFHTFVRRGEVPEEIIEDADVLAAVKKGIK